MTTRLQFVEVLEELRDVLVQIDNQTIDRRYVDFAALAARLDECIEKVEGLPEPSGECEARCAPGRPIGPTGGRSRCEPSGEQGRRPTSGGAARRRHGRWRGTSHRDAVGAS
jgi:hypothetical protein